MSYIIHSAKGTSWTKKQHKYKAIVNGRYIYDDRNPNTEGDPNTDNENQNGNKRNKVQELKENLAKQQELGNEIKNDLMNMSDAEAERFLINYANNYPGGPANAYTKLFLTSMIIDNENPSRKEIEDFATTATLMYMSQGYNKQDIEARIIFGIGYHKAVKQTLSSQADNFVKSYNDLKKDPKVGKALITLEKVGTQLNKFDRFVNTGKQKFNSFINKNYGKTKKGTAKGMSKIIGNMNKLQKKTNK